MSNGVNEPVDLRDRTLDFSRAVLKFVKTVPSNNVTAPLINQLVRSSTSVGANFIEAKNAGSKKDFRNKVLISKKEASETVYWLKLLEEFTDDKKLKTLQDECQQIVMILQKIINTLGH